MATLPATILATSELDRLPVVEEIVMIETALIDAGPRLRAVDEIWAGALGDLMLREGQRDAIDVCRAADGRFRLAGAGGHRLRGGQLREIEALKARVWPDDPNTAMLREIADILHRRDTDPYDRAVCVAEAVACIKRIRGIDPASDGRAASAHARWQKVLSEAAADASDTMSRAYGWTTEVAEQLGVNKRTIERDLLLHRRIDAAAVARLREARHAVATNGGQLRALAKLEASEQARVIEHLLDASAPAKSVSDAQARLRGVGKSKPDEGSKHFNAVLGALQRMSVSDRVGLFQSQQFHDLIPAEARRLLAPMLRDGRGAETNDANDVENAISDTRGRKARMAGAGRPALDGGPDADGERHDDGGAGEGAHANNPALAGRPGVSGEPADRLEALKPAVPIRASVKPDYMVCLECGEKLTNLQVHLNTSHKMRFEDYLVRWKLPADFPKVAPNSEPAGALLTECGGDLELLAAIVRSWLGKPDALVSAAIKAGGGTHRFANGTYEMKLGGVKATSTAGGENLIRAWLRKADERLNPEGDEE